VPVTRGSGLYWKTRPLPYGRDAEGISNSSAPLSKGGAEKVCRNSQILLEISRSWTGIVNIDIVHFVTHSQEMALSLEQTLRKVAATFGSGGASIPSHTDGRIRPLPRAALAQAPAGVRPAREMRATLCRSALHLLLCGASALAHDSVLRAPGDNSRGCGAGLRQGRAGLSAAFAPGGLRLPLGIKSRWGADGAHVQAWPHRTLCDFSRRTPHGLHACSTGTRC